MLPKQSEKFTYCVSTKMRDNSLFYPFKMGLLFDVSENRLDEVKIRLVKREDVNQADKNGNTALHLAAEKGFAEMTTLLIRHGANLNVANVCPGWSPLHYAAYEGHALVVQILLDGGATPDPNDNQGDTPETWAIERENYKCARILADSIRKKPHVTSEPTAKKEPEVQAKPKSDEIEDDDWVLPQSRLSRFGDLARISKLKEDLVSRLTCLIDEEKRQLETDLARKIEEFENMKKRHREEEDRVQNEISLLSEKLENLVVPPILDIAKQRFSPELGKELTCVSCSYICIPPTQIFQCDDGDLLCQTCKSNGELKTCPECNKPIDRPLARNRALEKLAQKHYQN